MRVQLTSLVHFENLRKQVLVLSPESRSVSEVSASEVVPWPVIWSLARYHRSHVWYSGTRPRMEALVHDFQQFAAKVRWKWHFREEPRGFYIHFKNSRYIPPYPLVTPPELEGWLSLFREKMLMTARTTLHNPTHQAWLKMSQDQLLGGLFERQRWRFHFGA